MHERESVDIYNMSFSMPTTGTSGKSCKIISAVAI